MVYLVLAGVVTLLFFTSQARHAREPDARTIQDFYHKTTNAMEREHGARTGAGGDGHGTEKVLAGHDVDADGDIDDDDEVLAKQMAERLRQAEAQAKDSARAKGPNKPDAPEAVIGVGSSASGQDRGSADSKAKVQETDEAEKTEEDHAVEVELDSILKKSPGSSPRIL